MANTVFRIKKGADLKKAYKKIYNGLEKPFKKSRDVFTQLGVQIDRDTMLTFKRQGAYRGREKWLGYNWGQGVTYKGTKSFPSSTRMRSGLYRIRYGTDLTGRKKGTYELFKKRTGIRRFSGSSKLLQASGGFKKSFKVLKIDKKKMLYGTRMDIAQKIMSNPDRQVVQVTERDKKRYFRTVYNWYNKAFVI